MHISNLGIFILGCRVAADLMCMCVFVCVCVCVCVYVYVYVCGGGVGGDHSSRLRNLSLPSRILHSASSLSSSPLLFLFSLLLVRLYLLRFHHPSRPRQVQVIFEDCSSPQRLLHSSVHSCRCPVHICCRTA